MAARPHLSLDAYADIETSTGLKHEYYCGSVYAMTGASPRHNLIVANVIALLHAQRHEIPALPGDRHPARVRRYCAGYAAHRAVYPPGQRPVAAARV